MLQPNGNRKRNKQDDVRK